MGLAVVGLGPQLPLEAVVRFERPVALIGELLGVDGGSITERIV